MNTILYIQIGSWYVWTGRTTMLYGVWTAWKGRYVR